MVINKKEDNNADGRWSWARFRHIPQPIDPAHNQENNPVDDNGPEEEAEEGPAHPHRRYYAMSWKSLAFTINAWCLPNLLCIVALSLPEKCGALPHDAQKNKSES